MIPTTPILQSTTVHHLQSGFDEAISYSRYHPSKGYSWDLKEKTGKIAERLPVKKETHREEPSSQFQRQRVDMLLVEFVKNFPIPTNQPKGNLRFLLFFCCFF